MTRPGIEMAKAHLLNPVLGIHHHSKETPQVGQSCNSAPFSSMTQDTDLHAQDVLVLSNAPDPTAAAAGVRTEPLQPGDCRGP